MSSPSSQVLCSFVASSTQLVAVTFPSPSSVTHQNLLLWRGLKLRPSLSSFFLNFFPSSGGACCEPGCPDVGVVHVPTLTATSPYWKNFLHQLQFLSCGPLFFFILVSLPLSSLLAMSSSSTFVSDKHIPFNFSVFHHLSLAKCPSFGPLKS